MSQPSRTPLLPRIGSIKNALPVAVLGLLMTGLFDTRIVHASDAATRSAARDLGYEGIEAYQAGRYEEAAEKLGQSYRALPAPSLALWSARALARSGRLVEAAERYLEAIKAPIAAGRDAAIQQAAQKEAGNEREALLPKIPRLRVTVAADDARREELRFWVNGDEVAPSLLARGYPVDPGKVTVEVALAQERQNKSLTLQQGQKGALEFEFPARTDPQKGPVAFEAAARTRPEALRTEHPPRQDGPSWIRTTGWTGVGVGAALLGMGGVTGAIALATFNNQNCDQSGACRAPTTLDDTKRVNTMRTVSLVGFISGGIVAAAGATLLISSSSQGKDSKVSAYLGWASAGVTGTF